MKAIDDGREELDHEELLSLEYLDAVVVSFHRLFLSHFDKTLTHPFLRSARDSSTRTGTHRDSSSSRQRRPVTYIDSHPLRNRPFENPLSHPDQKGSDYLAWGLRRQPKQRRVWSRCERVQTGEMVGRGEEDREQDGSLFGFDDFLSWSEIMSWLQVCVSTSSVLSPRLRLIASVFMNRSVLEIKAYVDVLVLSSLLRRADTSLSLHLFDSILSVLIDTFEFAPRNARTEIERGTQVITRPFVKGEVHLGTRMPLRILLARTDVEED